MLFEIHLSFCISTNLWHMALTICVSGHNSCNFVSHFIRLWYFSFMQFSGKNGQIIGAATRNLKMINITAHKNGDFDGMSKGVFTAISKTRISFCPGRFLFPSQVFLFYLSTLTPPDMANMLRVIFNWTFSSSKAHPNGVKWNTHDTNAIAHVWNICCCCWCFYI